MTSPMYVQYCRNGHSRGAESGIASGEHIVPLAQLDDFPDGILEACGSPQLSTHRLEKVVDATRTSAPEVVVGLDQVSLLPPVTSPEKIICLGLNYRDHAAEAGFEMPEVPVFFAKFRNALTGPFDCIVLPRSSKQVDFEGELAVVIGTAGKYVPVESALDHVAGYAVMNDVSARDLQLQTSQWTAGKTLDTFAPFGPGVVPRSLVPDPQDLEIETRVNGEVVQHDSTSSMLFGVAETIAYLSSLMTLNPGDVIATGTPAGVGFKRVPPLYLEPGDEVQVAIGGIGVIRNSVVNEG